MLQPKRTKWRRNHLVRPKAKASRLVTVAFGEYGLRATQGGYLSNRQLEAARVVLSRFTTQAGKPYIRVFPDVGITKKPAEVRMGAGKGDVNGWFAVVEPGTIRMEIGGIPEADCKEALHQAGYKLSVQSRIVKKGEENK